MRFGIALATAADAWKTVAKAEALGFTSAWFYDTQMLSADCFVAMGAAAVKTEHIRLGTGVLVPSNRIAPVTANAFASLNQLAPGRIDFGVGTGFTARRTMGMGAIKLAQMEEYLRVVYALLDGDLVETEMEGKPRKLKFLNPELGLINISDPVKLHVSAYGPKARALVAKLGSAWLNFVGDLNSGTTAMTAMRETWQQAGRNANDLTATSFILGCVLQPGEAANSPRALAQAGPRAALYLHRAADAELMGLPNSTPVPDELKALTVRYIAQLRERATPGAHYLDNHRGHLMFVREEERAFLTAELVQASTFTDVEANVVENLSKLRDAGYGEIVVQLTPGNEEAMEDWARVHRALT